MQPGLCKAGDELLQDVGHLDERTDRDELVDAVVAIAAGGKVGAGQTAERQLGAVGAATNWQHLGLNAAGKVGFLGNINKLGIVTNDCCLISTVTRSSPRRWLSIEAAASTRSSFCWNLAASWSRTI